MRVLIADDHAVLREGVKGILRSFHMDMTIDEAADGFETLSMLKEAGYDLLVLDLTMPGISGLDILSQIKDQGIAPRTFVLSCYEEDHYAIRAFKLGAVGYVSKCASFDRIREALHKVAGGGRYVSPELAEKIAFNETDDTVLHEKLSTREFQVMLLLAQGKSLPEIAGQIFVTDKTVCAHRNRILKKMNMRSNAELTIYAMKNGLVQ